MQRRPARSLRPHERRLARRRERVEMPRVNVLDREGRWNPNAEDEILWWPRVIWCDPGGVSGVAVVWFDPKALFVEDKVTAKVVLAYSEQFLHGPENGRGGQIAQYMAMRDVLDAEKGLATGMESFVVRQLNQSHEFLAPVRIRAGVEYAMSRLTTGASVKDGTGAHLFVQSPSDAISSFSNERLKALNMYRPGPDHVNDAKRHALLWIRRLKESSRGLEFFKNAHGFEKGWFE